ncbi:hypothetical protein C8T65DRAFT_665369 [Cerioporus squamosus]|nr:hypothetical protein C8T65DRAFT_665369 [Cerioporus squamosus]
MAGGKVDDTVTKGKKPLWQGRNVGKLMQMLNVPMDVSFEIMSHLEPKDILQLSRVSRELRSMLRSPTSRHIWMTARKNTVPPLHDPPEDMSEPQYAFLVFERFCENCGQGRALNADYALRVRLCGDCWRTDTLKGTALCRSLGLSKKKEIAEVLYTLTPRGTRTYSDQGWKNPLLVLDQEAKHWYYRPQFMPVAKKYLALSEPGQDPMALKRFVEERQAETLVRRNFHREMLRWESKRINTKFHTGVDAETERIAEIHSKLCALGYDKSEFPRYNHDWTQMLEQPRKLTPRIWNTIRPKLVAILEQLRAEREAKAFTLKWTKRREQLQAHYKRFLEEDRASVERRTLPSPADVVNLSCMRELMTAEEPDVELTEARFVAVRARLLVEAEEYRSRVKSELAIKLAAAQKPIPHSSSTPRRRRWVAGASLVAKLKQADESDNGMDSEEEDELLEDPKNVFKCRFQRTKKCLVNMSYLGLLEHLQIDHNGWNVEDILVPKPGDAYSGLDPEFAEGLLSALGLGNDATHSELDELMRSGRPQCSCGRDPMPSYESEPKWMILERLVRLSL